MKGLIYNEPPSVLGIHAESMEMSFFNPSINSSSGTLGMTILSADRFNLLAFSLGLKSMGLPVFLLINAFIPSKIDCP